MNFLRPAQGTRVTGRGRVVNAGETLSECTGEGVAGEEVNSVQIAAMLTTMVTVRDRDPVARADPGE